MAKPVKIPYDKIVAKYKTGQYSLCSLAKMFKVSKSSLSAYFNKNAVKINEQAEQVINDFDKGFRGLSKLVDKQTTEQGVRLSPDNENITLLVDEIFKIVKQRNPIFANNFNVIFSKVISQSNKMLDNDALLTKDLKNITSAMKDINDTLQVIPKPPAIAQQININKERYKREAELYNDEAIKDKEFNVNINFIKPSKIVDIEDED